ncbi:MAG: class I SAM-dependent methyltransferase [Candidatus Omnitrophota bacterium]|nr:class I SAM-dependent methyltransferase [Candidatus Omnitrophota bacterium]
MDKTFYDLIIAANIDVHKKEAGLYDIIHTFGKNWYAQYLLNGDIQRILRLAPGKKACDLGCGTGNVTRRLLDAGCEVTAVDLSAEMLEEMNKKMTDKNNLNTFCVNIDRFLQGGSDKYDIITINAVLHHMPDYLDTISLAMRRLSGGGMLYLVDGIHKDKPNKYYGFIRKCLLWMDKKLYILMHGNKKILFDHGIDYTYSDYHCNAAGTNGLDLGSIKELIGSNGLKLVRVSGYNIGMYLGTLAMLDDLISVSRNSFRLIAKKNN